MRSHSDTNKMTGIKNYGLSVVFGREKGVKYVLSYNPGKKEKKNSVTVYLNLADATARITPTDSFKIRNNSKKKLEDKVK